MENRPEYMNSENVNVSYDTDMTIPTFYQVSAHLENQAIPVSVHLTDGSIPSVNGLSGERPDVLAMATATILQGSYSDAPSYMPVQNLVLSPQQCSQFSALGPVLESSLMVGQSAQEGVIQEHEGVIHNLTTHEGLIEEHTTHASAIQRQTIHDSRFISHTHMLESSGLQVQTTAVHAQTGLSSSLIHLPSVQTTDVHAQTGLSSSLIHLPSVQTTDVHAQTGLPSSLIHLPSVQQVETGMVFGNQSSSNNPIILMKPTSYSANSMVVFLNSSAGNLQTEIQYSTPQVPEPFIEKKKRAARSKPQKKKDVQHPIPEPVPTLPKPVPTLPPDGIISSEEVGGMEMTSNTIIALMKKKFNKKGLKINECPYCKKGLSSREALRTHLRTHTGEKPYQCEDCGKSFSDCSVFRRHQRIHTGEKPYICDVCGRAFNQSTSLEAHKRTHTGTKKYTCEVCGLGFDKLQQLVDHCKAEEHGNTQTYKCTKCSVEVQDETALKRHMCSHTGERAYTCHICGAKWEKQYGLMEHLRMHAGIKPYDCPNCNERFVRKGDLRVHMSRHVSGKFTPHKCLTCGEGFRQKTQLMVHERTHTGIKPYECKACGKSFYSWKELREHRRRHVGKRIYKCDVCTKTFAAMNTLKVHVKMHLKNGAINCSVCLKMFHNINEFVHHTRFEHIEKKQNASNSESSDSDGPELTAMPVKRKKKQVKKTIRIKRKLKESKKSTVKPTKPGSSSDETSSEIIEAFDDLSSSESSNSEGDSSDKQSTSPSTQDMEDMTGITHVRNKEDSAINQTRITSIHNDVDVTSVIKRSVNTSVQNSNTTQSMTNVKEVNQIKESCNVKEPHMEGTDDSGSNVQKHIANVGSESVSISPSCYQGKVSGIENLVRASVFSDSVSVQVNSLPSEDSASVAHCLNSQPFQTDAGHEHPARGVPRGLNDVTRVTEQTDSSHEHSVCGVLRGPGDVSMVTEQVNSGHVVTDCGALRVPGDVAVVTKQTDSKVDAEHSIVKGPVIVEVISTEKGDSSHIPDACGGLTESDSVVRVSEQTGSVSRAACGVHTGSDSGVRVSEQTGSISRAACVILRGRDNVGRVSLETLHSTAVDVDQDVLRASEESLRVSTEQFPLIAIPHSLPSVSMASALQDLQAVEQNSMQLLSRALLTSVNSGQASNKPESQSQAVVDAHISGYIHAESHAGSLGLVCGPNYERTTENDEKNAQEAPVIHIVYEKDVELEKQVADTQHTVVTNIQEATEMDAQHAVVTSIQEAEEMDTQHPVVTGIQEVTEMDAQHAVVTTIQPAADHFEDHTNMEDSDYSVTKPQEPSTVETHYHQFHFNRDQLLSNTNNGGQSHTLHKDNNISVPIRSQLSENDCHSQEADDIKVVQLNISSNGEKDADRSQILSNDRIPINQSQVSENSQLDIGQGKIVSDGEQMPVSSQDGGYLSYGKYLTLSSEHPASLQNQYTSVSPSKDYANNLSLYSFPFQQGISSQTANFVNSAQEAKLYIGRGYSSAPYNLPQDSAVYFNQPQNVVESRSVPTTVDYSVNLQTLINTSLAQEASKVVKDRSQSRKVDRGYARKMYQSLECQYCGKGLSSVPALKNHEMIHTGERPYKCECGKSFIDSSTFKRHQRIHTGIKPYMCDVCGKQFNQSNSYRTHMTCHTGEKHYKCNICGRSFDKLKNLMEHNQRENHGDVKKHTCEICNAVFRDAVSLHRHMCSHTGEKAFKCEHCDKSYEKQYQFNEHMRSHAGFKPFRCDICGDSFLRKGQLKFHVYKHQYGRQFECDVCRQAFYRSTDLMVHKRIHTGEKPFKCNQCDKSFRQKWECKNHQLWDHSAEKPFTCEKCLKTFKKAYSLKLHMENKHVNEKRHKCFVCKKRFRKLENLKKHTKKHRSLNCRLCQKHFLTEKKTQQHMEKFHKNDKKVKKITKKKEKQKLECTECKKKFCFKYDLDEHRRLHTGENAYKCSVCSKIFSREYHLSIHLMKHTGEKRFKCDECGEPFASGKHLKNHRVEKHGASDADIFKCEICQREFSDRNTMKKHVKSHSSEKPYECLVCNRRYQYSWNLKIHEKSMHTGDMPFKCQFCEKKFTHKRDYRDHVRSHTDDLPFKCPHDKCGRSFASQRALRMHQPIHFVSRCLTPGMVSVPEKQGNLFSGNDVTSGVAPVPEEQRDLSNANTITPGIVSPVPDEQRYLSNANTITPGIVSPVSDEQRDLSNANTVTPGIVLPVSDEQSYLSNANTITPGIVSPVPDVQCNLSNMSAGANRNGIVSDSSVQYYTHTNPNAAPETIQNIGLTTSCDADGQSVVKNDSSMVKKGLESGKLIQLNKDDQLEERVQQQSVSQSLVIHPADVDVLEGRPPAEHARILQYHVLQNSTSALSESSHETVRHINSVEETDVAPSRKHDELVLSHAASSEVADTQQLDPTKHGHISLQSVGRNDVELVFGKSYMGTGRSLGGGKGVSEIRDNQGGSKYTIRVPVVQARREHTSPSYIASAALTSVIRGSAVGSLLYSDEESHSGHLKTSVDYHMQSTDQPHSSAFTGQPSNECIVYTEGCPINYSLPVYKDASKQAVQSVYREHIQLMDSRQKSGPYEAADSSHSQSSLWNTTSDMLPAYNPQYDVADCSNARFHNVLSAHASLQDSLHASLEQSEFHLPPSTQDLQSLRVESFPTMTTCKISKDNSVGVTQSSSQHLPCVEKYRYLEEIGVHKSVLTSEREIPISNLVNMTESSEKYEYLQSQIPLQSVSSIGNEKLLNEVSPPTSAARAISLSTECSYPPVSVFTSIENKVPENQVIIGTQSESCKPVKKCKFFKHSLADRSILTSRSSGHPVYTTCTLNPQAESYNVKYNDLEQGSSAVSGRNLQELLPVDRSRELIGSLVRHQDSDYNLQDATNFQVQSLPEELASNRRTSDVRTEVKVASRVEMLSSSVPQATDGANAISVSTQEQCVAEYFSYNWSKPITTMAGGSFTDNGQDDQEIIQKRSEHDDKSCNNDQNTNRNFDTE